jgi:SAM-dependent methyltransferase
MAAPISRSEGGSLFGRDSALYERARPGYPERVYELLVERCGLANGCRTIEVGVGSGRATRRLLELGARPLVAVKPDPGFEIALESLARASDGAVVPLFSPFESANVQEGAFDLAVGATSFHWLDRVIGPRKLGGCLRPGGWLALSRNVFGDPRQPDPFHEATAPLLSGLATAPSHPCDGSLPFALDRDSRRSDFHAAQADRDFMVEEIHWPRASIARLPDLAREPLLDKIESIAERRFGGAVERRMVTPIHLGRRAG